MNRKQIIYGVIYVGLLFTIPSLGKLGLTFVGGVIKGVIDGLGAIEIDWFKIIF